MYPALFDEAVVHDCETSVCSWSALGDTVVGGIDPLRLLRRTKTCVGMYMCMTVLATSGVETPVLLVEA